MGFFTFLTGDQEQAPPDLQKPVRVPKGAKVRRAGEDFSRLGEEWAAEGDEVLPADNTPTGKETPQLRRDVVSKEDSAAKLEQNAIKKIHGALQQVYQYKDDSTYKDARDPQILQVKDALDKGMLKPHQLIDDIQELLKKPRQFPGLNEALVSGLNDLKVSQEQRAQVKTEADELGQAPQMSGETLLAHSDEAFAQAKKLREEAGNLGVLRRGNRLQQATNLEQQAAGLKEMSDQPKPQETPPQFTDIMHNPEPVSHFLDGLGIPKEEIPGKVHAALNAVGIPQEQWGDDNVDPSAGILRVISALDKQGVLQQSILQQLTTARQQDAADKQNQGNKGQQDDPRIAQTQRQIQNREQEIRALYAQLRESPFMHTWPGIILYVLVGMITQNPAFAARLIGGVGNREQIGGEIRGIQFEIRRLDAELARREHEDAASKREAAKRLQHVGDEADQRKWELSKMMIQHNLIIERNAKRGNPETFLMKKLAGDFQRSLGMASKFETEMGDYGRRMNNELAPEADRMDAKKKWSDAKRNYDYYMQKAASVDQDIRKMGGSVDHGAGDIDE